VESTGLTGSLLLAMPQLLDPNFERAVILMVHHDTTSSFGLVVNRETDLMARELVESLDLVWRGAPDARVSWGGPVELTSGWMLFSDDARLSEPDIDQVTALANGLRFTASLEIFQEVTQDPPDDVRLFLGYAGWGPGQLESEIAQGAWLSVPANSETIFDVPSDEMWDHGVRSLGVDPGALVSTSGIH
jgi:putative transcriptional regulator